MVEQVFNVVTECPVSEWVFMVDEQLADVQVSVEIFDSKVVSYGCLWDLVWEGKNARMVP